MDLTLGMISLTVPVILMTLMTLMVTHDDSLSSDGGCSDLTASSGGSSPPDLAPGQIGHRTRFTFTPSDLRFLLTNQT